LLDGFLRQQVVAHLLDPRDFLLGSDVGSFESFSHTWTFANAVGHSIN
jgi:hypothetical protein